jgi:Ca-activated chloride channel family protein
LIVMFRFANPEYLYLLLLVPLAIIVYCYNQYSRKKRLSRMGEVNLVRELMPEYSATRKNLKFTLLILALAGAVLICARPQFGIKEETVKKQGVEIMIALDISRSMLAEDVSPNRLERAKMLISKLIDSFDEDRVGLIVFAGDAFVQLPITNDFVSAKMFLQSITPDLISRQGTNLYEAINLAANSFTAQENIGKSIIIITDGENHEAGAKEAAEEAAKKGYKIHVLGVGLPEGAPIPDPKTGGYHKDRSGQTVITRMNEDVCREISKIGQGIFARVDNSDQAGRVIAAEVEKMQKAETEHKSYKEYDEQFIAMAWLVLFLLIFEVFLLEKKNPRFKGFSLFGKPMKKKGQDKR